MRSVIIALFLTHMLGGCQSAKVKSVEAPVRVPGEMSVSSMSLSAQQRLARLEPTPEEAIFERITAAFQRRNSQDLEAELKKLKSLRADSPFIPSALYMLGLMGFESQDRSTAKSRFSEVVNLYPNSDRVPGALYALGYLEQTERSYGQAKSIYQKLISDYPESLDANRAKMQMEIIARGLVDYDVDKL